MESLIATHWFAVLLVLVTGVIHVYAGFVEGAISVTLAGVGFLGGAVMFLVGYRRRQLYLVGIAYTVVQFPLWYVAKAGEYTTIGYVDRVVQAVLIVVLVYLYWWERKAPEHDREATTA